MKKVLCILMSVLLLVLTGCSSQTPRIRFGAGGIGGAYYAFGSAYTEFITQKDSDYNFEVKATAGSPANLRLLSEGYIQLGIAQTDLITEAYNGTDSFEGNKCRGYKAIAALYTEACQIVVRADSDILSLDDLQGHTVSIGESDSGTERNATLILQANGFNDKLVQTVNLNYTEAASNLASGQIDAMFCTAGVRTTVIEELSKTCAIRLLDVPKACMQKLKAADSFYTDYIIPANTYTGQTQEVRTLGVPSVLLASDNLSEETVKELTSILFDNAADLQFSVPVDLNRNPELAVKGVTIPFHPGAVAYYQEAGISLPSK